MCASTDTASVNKLFLIVEKRFVPFNTEMQALSHNCKNVASKDAHF